MGFIVCPARCRARKLVSNYIFSCAFCNFCRINLFLYGSLCVNAYCLASKVSSIFNKICCTNRCDDHIYRLIFRVNLGNSYLGDMVAMGCKNHINIDIIHYVSWCFNVAWVFFKFGKSRSPHVNIGDHWSCKYTHH